MDLEIILHLKQRIQQPLPGKIAQYVMAPVPGEKYSIVSDNPKLAAVLILLYPKDGEWTIALMKRKSYKGDKHSGQISFPGGGLEEYDESLESCALREAHEELNIEPEHVQVIGPMTPLYVYVSDFLVYPYLAYTENAPEFIASEDEVEALVEVPLAHLLHPDTAQKTFFTIRDHTIPSMPYFNLDGQILWGATAMMINELLYIIREDLD